MQDYVFYTFGHREYFETMNNFPIRPTYVDLLRSLLPLGWTISRFDIWLQANCDKIVLGYQGFKIHLSSCISNAETMLKRIVPVCTRAEVQFKIVADPTLHRFLNSKRYPRNGSGKFATIYPPDENCFRALIAELHEVTMDFEGPYILSDKRYRTSKVVFYRYGGFQSIRDLKIDGASNLMIQASDGTFVADERLPYFKLPNGVQDPLTDDGQAPQDSSDLLHDRYKVIQALSFSNTGGAYLAVDQNSGRTVVIKEARPHTLMWVGGTDLTMESTAALHHEYACLQRLGGLSCVPQLVELYQEWEHTFLVESYFDGIPLAEFRAHDEFIILSKIGDPQALGRSCCIWRDVCLRLLDAIYAIHLRGVIVGDVSPGNVLLKRETGEITLIDMESALLSDAGEDIGSFGTQWYNPGFRKPESGFSRPLTQFDDFYACGMLLYNLVCPIQNIFELDKAHPRFRILDHFVQAGLPAEVARIIHALLEGQPEEAHNEAKAWDPLREVESRTIEHSALSKGNIL